MPTVWEPWKNAGDYLKDPWSILPYSHWIQTIRRDYYHDTGVLTKVICFVWMIPATVLSGLEILIWPFSVATQMRNDKSGRNFLRIMNSNFDLSMNDLMFVSRNITIKKLRGTLRWLPNLFAFMISLFLHIFLRTCTHPFVIFCTRHMTGAWIGRWEGRFSDKIRNFARSPCISQTTGLYDDCHRLQTHTRLQSRKWEMVSAGADLHSFGVPLFAILARWKTSILEM